MYGSSYVFTKSFFTGWVIFGVAWMMISFIIVGIYPLVHGYETISAVFKNIYSDLTRKSRRNNEVRDSQPTNNEQTGSFTTTPF
jgi:hypothetical protein